jgi:hypothetical protein
MRKWLAVLVSAVAVVGTLGIGNGLAAEQQILGKRLLLRDPTGEEAKRRVVLLAKESATDIGSLVGNPVTGGAFLSFGLDSGSSGEVFFLDEDGWSATPTGFRYVGPTGVDGDPVAKLILRRTLDGTAVLKITLKGSVGAQPVVLVPPNPGSDAVAVLTLADGDTYCASFGGAAGGEIGANSATTFRIRNATDQPGCPTLCCSFGASCTWGEGVSLLVCGEQGGFPGLPGTACDGATGACTPPPAAPGNCCEFAVPPFCFGGPGVQEPPCSEFSGTFSSNAICDPNAEACVPPP